MGLRQHLAHLVPSHVRVHDRSVDSHMGTADQEGASTSYNQPQGAAVCKFSSVAACQARR